MTAGVRESASGTAAGLPLRVETGLRTGGKSLGEKLRGVDSSGTARLCSHWADLRSGPARASQTPSTARGEMSQGK